MRHILRRKGLPQQRIRSAYWSKVTKTLSRGLQAETYNQWPTATQTTAHARVLSPLTAAFVLCVVFSISQKRLQPRARLPTRTRIADGFSEELSPASPYPPEIAVSGTRGLGRVR